MNQLKRGRDGRVESRYDLRTLLDAVAVIARLANPDKPLLTRQADYDAARAAAGYADAPTGKQTAQRFGLAWRALLALALDEERDLDKALGNLVAAENDETLDEMGVRIALRTVAVRLGKRTLAPADYTRERDGMLAAASLRHRPVELVLPTALQVLRVAGSWDAALEIAGLEPRPGVAFSVGLPVVDALELALESFGCLPTRDDLHTFAAANGFSVARIRRPYPEYVAELHARRADWGKWTPSASPLAGQRPDWRVPVELPRNITLVEKRKRRWTREECIDAIARLLDELGSTRMTQRVYQERVVGRRDFPALGSIQRHGGFTELLAEARTRRRRRPS
jgi:hypothetical protein